MGCGKKCLVGSVALVAVLGWVLKVYPWQWWRREFSLVPPVSYGMTTRSYSDLSCALPACVMYSASFTQMGE